MEGGELSRSALYGVLLDQLRALEASQEKLSEQLSMLSQEKNSLDSSNDSYDGTRSESRSGGEMKSSSEVGMEDYQEMEADSGWAYIPGRFYSGTPCGKVLECMGHAVHISRVGSEEVIYWNRSAEKLYGYKDYEALGQREKALIVDEKHHALAGRIMESLSSGQNWSGQFPLKKRSGEVFMAMVTKSVLYEDGQLVGIITVSSDAAIFNNGCPENASQSQDRTYGHSRRINLKNLQWHPKPAMIASSVTHLVSKVILRKDEDIEQHRFSNTGEKKLNDMDIPDVTRSKFNSKFPAGEGSENEESSNENSPPLKFAQKVLAKFNIAGIGNTRKDKDIINWHTRKDNDIINWQNSFADTSSDKQISNEQSSPEKKTSDEPFSPESKQATTFGNCTVDDAKCNVEPSAESSHESNKSSSSKSDNELKMNAHWKISWEDLQLGEELGQGSFAVVYHGIWNESDVAVKVYHGNKYRDDTLHDYSIELDIMRRLRHPNVLLFMGAVCSGEKLALVTEFLPRGSLYKALHKSNQHLDIRRRLRMALDVAKGMNYLHHRKPPIVHRDLKSSNLLVDKSWTVKVGDFGLSKFKEATFLTAKSGKGTPQWMAPEVLRNEPSTEKSDVFSFGVVLWELITESIPWSNLNFLQVVGVVGFMDNRLDIPENLNPRVSSIIQDCWQSNAENRPSFEDIIVRMIDAIRTLSGGNAGNSPEV